MVTPLRRVFIPTMSLVGPVAVILLFTTGVAADSRLEFKKTEGGAAVVETMFIGHGKVRFDRGKTISVIIDPETKTMTALDHEKKEFTRVGDAELEEMAKAWKQGIDDMKELLASMPPDERADMEAALKGLLTAADDMKIIETGESTVAGKPCRVYRTTAKDVVINETCFSDIAALNLSTADRDTLNEAMSLGQDQAQRMVKFISPHAAEQMAPFRSGQVALRTTDVAKGERNTSEFVRVTTDALSVELFTVPATYKEVKFGGGLGGLKAAPRDVR
jgi:hypothetical protein